VDRSDGRYGKIEGVELSPFATCFPSSGVAKAKDQLKVLFPPPWVYSFNVYSFGRKCAIGTDLDAHLYSLPMGVAYAEWQSFTRWSGKLLLRKCLQPRH